MFDYVVVGAGSAGCVLAARLTEDPDVRVLLLEAGGPGRPKESVIPAAFAKLFGTARDWDYRTAPQPALGGRRLRWPRGKMLGGSSAMNAQMYVRGQRADYDGWAAGCPGWGFDAVRPHFARAEGAGTAGPDRLGREGPLRIADLRDPNELTRAFLAATAGTGIAPAADVNGDAAEGAAATPVTQHRGRRFGAADAYLRPARRRPNLTVRTGAHVRRVLLDGRRAVGVELARPDGGTEEVRVTGEVLLAAGTVNSPQLLMLSGIGPAEQLAGVGVPVALDLPGVGANLQDHLAVVTVRLTDRPVSLAAAERVPELLRFLLRGRGMLTSNVAEALALVRSDPAVPAPDLELVFAPVPFLDHGQTPPPGHGYSVGAVLIQPRSRGSVRLASADPFAAPLIDPGYLTDPEGADLRRLLHGVRLAERILDAPAFAGYAGRPLQPRPGEDLAEYVRARAETLYHPVGTCRMGITADCVVDPELRVHGVERLRVADASVMPQIIRGHTHAPTVMIAERAAEFVRTARRPGRPTTVAEVAR